MSGPVVQDLGREITADAERVRTVDAARRGGHRYSPRLAPRARWLCESLDLLPFLRTHYLAMIRPPGTDHAAQEGFHG